MRTSWLSSFLPLLAAVVTLHAAAAAQCTPQWVPGNLCPAPEGIVRATTTWDPDGPGGPAAPLLVVGGQFTVGSQAHVGVAAYDGANWVPFGDLTGYDVHAFAVFNGQLVAASTGDGGSHGISVWNGSTWQNVGAISGYVVNALAVYQGFLYAGGEFSAVNGTPASCLARWDGTSWSAIGSGLNLQVRTMAVFNNVLYVGGEFTVAGGLSSMHLAVWNGSAWVAQPPFNGDVWTLAVRNGTAATNSFLFAGGSFTSIAGGAVLADKVARFSPATNSWSAMGSLNSCVSLLVRSTGLTSYVVLAGEYSQNGSAVRQWNGTGWSLLGAIENGEALSLAYYGGQYVQGTIVTATHAALRSFVSGAWQDLSGPGFRETVTAVLEDDGDVFLGGAFGVLRGTSNAWSAVGGAFQGTVSVLSRLPNGDVIAAGNFTVAGGVNANHIARWDGTNWNPLGAGVDDEVLAVLPLANGQLLASGLFTQAGGVPAPYIARWNGSAWSDIGGGCNAPVRALAELANGDIVAGGDFTAAGGFTNTCWRIARWNGMAWSPMGAAQGFSSPVLALAVEASGTVLAGGMFSYYQTTPVFGIARWNGTTWSAASPMAWGARWLSPLPNGEFYACYQDYVQRLPGGQLVGGANSIHSMSLTKAGSLLIGGEFTVVDNIVSSRVAELRTPCPAIANSLGSGCTGAGGINSLAVNDLPWLGSTFRATGTGLPSPALVLVVTGFSPTASPVPLTLALPQALPGCNLLVSPDALDVQFATGGVATSQLSVPLTASLVGASFYQQMVPIQVNAAFAFLQVTATNAVQATIGSL